MNRTGVGAITITDIKDGVHPLSMVLSNQSHTFAADNFGTVLSAEMSKFFCELYVYVGDARATYDLLLSANSTYSVAITSSTGWVSSATVVNNQLVIAADTIPSGVINKTGVFNLVVSIKNTVGAVTEVASTISLSKAIEGAGGAAVYLTPTRQTFRFSESGETADDNIVINVASAGNVGVLTATKSVNGSSTFSALAVGGGESQASSIDVDGLLDNDRIVISKSNFGSSDVLTVKVTGSTGGSDLVSIVKIQKGDTGNASLSVSISSNVGGSVFKNNTGLEKTLTARVHDMADGTEILENLTYQWRKNGIVVGTNTNTHNVTASDVTDGGSEEYSCTVTLV